MCAMASSLLTCAAHDRPSCSECASGTSWPPVCGECLCHSIGRRVTCRPQDSLGRHACDRLAAKKLAAERHYLVSQGCRVLQHRARLIDRQARPLHRAQHEIIVCMGSRMHDERSAPLDAGPDAMRPVQSQLWHRARRDVRRWAAQMSYRLAHRWQIAEVALDPSLN